MEVRSIALAVCVSVPAALAVHVAPARAHPHVFVNAEAELIFDVEQRLSAVRNIWTFDEAYSAYATLGLDADGDGRLSREELEPLAQINVESLQEYAYFTFLTVGDAEITFKPPHEYDLVSDGERLTLTFIIELEEPVAIAGGAELEVFDQEYFVAFEFSRTGAVRLVNAAAGCTAVYHPPKLLDANIMQELAAIPADQRTLPESLTDVTQGLANRISVTCAQ